MKKIASIILIITMAVLMLTGCNKQIVDITYSYNYAIIQLPNGDIVEGKIQSWNDYDGEQLQVKIDGVIYLVSSYKCVLIKN